jgi:rhodanese-related sulfurtransferase
VADVGTISREDLRSRIDGEEDLVLLEVLGAASYGRGHLPGAVRFQNPDDAEAVIPDKSAFVVAYCSDYN